MYVASVALQDFRNYRSVTVRLGPTVNLLVGANGQGKSNFLEAVGVLSVGKSIRGALDADVVRWGAQGGRVNAELVGTTATEVEVRILPGQRKQACVDGALLPTLSDLIGIVRAVHLTPDLIDQQFRSPTGRRRMVDILLSQMDSDYLHALKRHRQIVTQVNSLCKQPKPNTSSLDIWERQLATVATEIVRKRRDLLGPLQHAAAEHFRSLFGSDTLELRMRPTLPADDDEGAIEACAEALRNGRSQALRTGFVSKGAHRDRFDVFMDGRQIETHASQGQTKAAYFAWKLAEGDVIEQRTDMRPVWLVDDPFSEMDRRRALRVLEAFCDRGQVLLTSARDSDLDLETRGFTRLRVHDGVIEHADRT